MSQASSRQHNAGWQIERLDDGSFRWTAPTGHIHIVPPPTTANY
jgi:hypothetical protein